MNTPSESRWARVTALFAEAAEIPRTERAAFLASACNDDPSIAQEVTSLLDAHDRASNQGFLEAPAAALDPTLLDDDGSALVGKRLGPYSIEEVIGRGGMGVVFRAEDTRLGRAVALKIVPPRLTTDEGLRERLRREARAAAALSHPAIATVFALEECDGQWVLASELVRGRTLREELADGPLPPDRLLATLRSVASALAAAHAAGIVHRDLKPENIRRATGGDIKVLDFGIARVTGSGPAERVRPHTATGLIVGTPGYMAPEQLQGIAADPRADVFAFGVLAYELATGRHPFGGGDAASLLSALLEGRTPLVAEAIAPAPLDAVVRRCLRARREERYGSAVDLLRDLERLDDPPHALVGAAGLRWWQVHQLAIGALHAAAVAALWPARHVFVAPWGAIVFYAALALATLSVTMRVNLWFTSRYQLSEVQSQRARVAIPVTISELLLDVVLIVAALRAASAEHVVGPLLLVFAIVSLVSLIVIEPATTRSAYRV